MPVVAFVIIVAWVAFWIYWHAAPVGVKAGIAGCHPALPLLETPFGVLHSV
jgi:hypothetical protein